jgi:hypothetical protein
VSRSKIDIAGSGFIDLGGGGGEQTAGGGSGGTLILEAPAVSVTAQRTSRRILLLDDHGNRGPR